MSQSAQSRTKRMRAVSPSEELPNSTAMRAVPTRDPGSVTPKSPAHQAGSVDTQTFLLEMIQTEIGVADLAAALKPRYVRDALKRRGVKIEADDDVGYNSLPLELRDNIRDCLIAVVQPQEEKGFISQSQKCQRCSRLAPYACINSEWRDAIEAVNFQRLKLGDYPASLKQDLELFERFVVDSRRKHLQYIRLRVDTLGLMIGADSRGDEPPEEDIVNAFTSPISRLLNCVQQWDEHITGDGNLHVHILTSNQDGWRTDPYPVSRTVLHAGLSKLPITPQITHLSTVLWDSFDSASLVALLSRMPNLRSLSIEVSTSELPEDTQERDSQTQLFFNSLPQTVQCLESLEVKCSNYWAPDSSRVTFCTAALSYSQILHKFTLREITLPALLTILSPFSTPNFNPDAPPPLTWPNLTNFTVGRFHDAGVGDEHYTTINDSLLAVGRAIRYMPRIQIIEMGLGYYLGRSQNASLLNFYCGAEFELELDSSGDFTGPLAKLCFTHRRDPCLVEKVPSKEVIEVWRESLSHAANATLEVHVDFLTRGDVWMLDVTGVEEVEEMEGVQEN